MKTNLVLDQFWRHLSAAKKAVLLLDYDGTLAPFRVARDRAFPYPGIRELLRSIRGDTQTRLVIISGRAVDDLLPLLALDPHPEIWGCHGWERLAADGGRPALELPKRAAAGLRKARLGLEGQGFDSLCEIKPASLALHWRGLPDRKIGELRERVDEHWLPIAAAYGLDIHAFNGGLELRCPGRNKGTALNTILEESEAGQPIAFLGDDRTDEDGFEALKGRGLGILVNSVPRQTRADLTITPPDDLLDFLATWRDRAPEKTDSSRGSQS